MHVNLDYGSFFVTFQMKNLLFSSCCGPQPSRTEMIPERDFNLLYTPILSLSPLTTMKCKTLGEIMEQFNY